jgi:hypothetical protein
MTQSNKSQSATKIEHLDTAPPADAEDPNDSRSSRKPSHAKVGKKATKAQAVLKLLRRKKGASIEELMKATGWQPHSVRGFLSGTIRTRMGLILGVDTTKSGIRRYRVLETASDETVAGASS